MDITEDICRNVLDYLSMKFTNSTCCVIRSYYNEAAMYVTFGNFALTDSHGNPCTWYGLHLGAMYKPIVEYLVHNSNLNVFFVWSPIINKKVQVISKNTSIEQLVVEADFASVVDRAL